MKTLCASACVVVAGLASTAQAAIVNLGTAGNYAVVATGTGISMNSGPNVGDVLLGQGINASFSGGGNGAITGVLYYDSTVTGTNTFNQLQTPPTIQQVATSVTLTAENDAIAASIAAQNLTPTQTFGAINGTQTITGNGGVNVINIASLQNAPLTLSGTASDVFIFNVTGNFATNQPMTLSGGVLPSRILFNLLGTSGNIFQTSGGNTLFGTFLSTRGGNFQFSNLVLTGALINTGGNVAIVSGSRVTYQGFVPAPGAAAFLVLAGGLALRRRR
ncbi:MAG: hypothetical protein IBJ11_01780 [Phycisphaerales bacterium]|nr:hypothetical protein [Phycisphaerales bacterium]